jgi:UDP:flavonoid glycosyltransferase YjiC (YdhE family)
MAAGKRIVLATFGSLGDLHPILAVALGLKERGHRPVLVTQVEHKAKVDAAGVEFAPLRPALDDLGERNELLRRIMDQRTGPEFIIRQVVMPHVRAAYEDIAAAARGADFLVSHVLTLPVPIVAEKFGIPWASTALQPFAFFSTLDFPVIPLRPEVAHWRWLGPRVFGALLSLMKWMVRPWCAEVYRLRADLGLSRGHPDPFFDGQWSPQLNLALFSQTIARPQPDWPKSTVVTGFPFFDRGEQGEGMGHDLRQFVDSGPPPVVFTLGSSGVYDAGSFYYESAKAAVSAGVRAVLVIGNDERNRPDRPLPASIHVAEYAPYSELFPRAAAVVHQGGVGTIGQTLRAGVPMIVMPFSHDQPDNADRVRRLGVARVIDRGRYGAGHAARQLRRLLGDANYKARAALIGKRVGAEDGVAAACDAIEQHLATGVS